MKRIYILFCLIFLVFANTVAQEKKSADKVALANQMYKQGQFTDAARIYEEELKSKNFTREELKKGDIIFTGTPEGVAKVNPNDVLEGFIEDKRVLRLHIK